MRLRFTTPCDFAPRSFAFFFPSGPCGHPEKTKRSEKLGPVVVGAERAPQPLEPARLYDFCNCNTTHGHVRERLILVLERGLPPTSFPCAASLRPLCRRDELLAVDRFRRPGPPSWGGENGMQVEGSSEGCSERPEAALSRIACGAGAEASSMSPA
jgi:hypothetical protein